MYAHYMQNSESDCGIATLRTVLKQLKYKVTESELYKNYHIKHTQGLSLANLREILGSYGISSNAYGVDEFSELKKVKNFPMILVVENDGMAHYILVHEIRNGKFIVSDPVETEIKTYSDSYIESIFLGYALCIEDAVTVSNKSKKETSEDTSIGNIIYTEIMDSLPKKEKFKLVILMLLKYILPLTITLIIQSAIDIKSYGIVFPLVASAVLMTLFYIVNKKENMKKTAIENMIQDTVLTKYYNQKMNDIYSGKNIENISGYFWNLFYSVNGLLEKFYLNLNLVYLSMLLVLLGVLSPTLMIVVLIIGSAFVFCLAKQIVGVRKLEKDIIGKSSSFFQTVEDNIQNSFDINILRKKSEAENFVIHKMNDYFASKLTSVAKATTISSTYEVFNVAVLMSVFLFFTMNNPSNNLLNSSNGILIVSMILSSVSPVIQTWLNYEVSKVSIDHIQSSNDYNNSVEEDKINKLPFQEVNKLSLRDISFSYNEQKGKVISNLDLELESGKIYAISGKNGVGKSTLIKLISGILHPDSGSFVLNDSFNSDSFKETDINRFISMYSSDCGIYKNSLIRNIYFKVFNEDMPSQEKTNYEDIFNLGFPASYLIQNNGSNLSQGQKQKVLLMRTLLQEKSIYIFDEPTGNLDFKSKETLKNEIKKLANNNKMVILISHEENVLEIADEIVQLKEVIL